MNIAKNYQFYMRITAVGFVCLAMIGLWFFSFYLDEYATSFGEAFSLQNTRLIESGEVLELGLRLEATKKTGSVECIWATSNNRIFYQFGSVKCGSGFLGRLVEVTAKGHEGISIIFRIKLPWKVQMAFLSFISLNILVILFIIIWIRSYEAIKLEAEAELSKLSKQVAHDIRSPLSALNLVISTFKDAPEEKRLIIRNAVQRINDIANDLLQKSKKSENALLRVENNGSSTDLRSGTLSLNRSVQLLPTIIDSIVSEKRIQYRDKINIKIEADLKNSFGIFVNANASELSRVISNLINNSVEALLDSSGEVLIGVRSFQGQAQISVWDNGRGIPNEIIRKMGQIGISYGKDSAIFESGNGIGIYHAKKTIESWQGQFRVQSKVGVGTLIEILLPKSQNPKWFASEIFITAGTTVISIDDDLSIHQIWKDRLESLAASSFNIKLICFTSTNEFMNFPLDESMVFLIDYEFLNQNQNGLDLILDRNLNSKAILVTSRHEEVYIQEICEKKQIKLLPKQLAGFVPINIKSEIQQIVGKQLDYILLDDDDLVRSTWKINAEFHGHQIKIYSSSSELMADIMTIDNSTRFYIDSNLGINKLGIEIRGEDVANEIFRLGFKNIYLATGYEPDKFSALTFLKGVVGKDPPS